MKNKTKEQEELLRILNLSRLQGVAKSQKAFAKIIGIDPSTISSMLNGSMSITRQMMKRIRDAVTIAGVVIEGNGNATASSPNSTAQVLSRDMSALIKEMGEQRRSFEEQLRAKDLQMAECMKLLKDAISSGKK